MSSDHNDAGGSSPASARGGFDAADSNQPKGKENTFQFRADIDLGEVATKAEKEFLEANRPKPEMELNLTPEGGFETTVKQKVNVEQERRIQKIGNSLRQAQDRLRNGFAKSQDRGVSQAQDREYER
ncbi:hypothetical protein [Ahrensia sp. R2A130]|uniref:hypothetical protein n=1 Tax=Ahrensia sp. R2A130 TaxID=744979 RepID=UPI0001E0C304|nr:hypothetical protein [Ahrensia sp. R2A130]EFL90213.1 hypothetical protein R2A130_0283 [Ahrensia sp. R2A130]